MTERIIQLIETYFDLPAGSIEETTSLRQDLNLDSIDLFEVQLLVEEEYHREIPDEIADEIDTVQDLVNWLNS